jgi:hypothetical protein
MIASYFGVHVLVVLIVGGSALVSYRGQESIVEVVDLRFCVAA